MRPVLPLRATWRQLNPKRHITTKPATFANIKYELYNRPPKTYYDYLTPTNSRLLSLSLADLIPHAQIHGQHGLAPPVAPWAPTSLTSNPTVLSQGHHLVHFPPDHPTLSLLPDGTDADHSPGPPFIRRVWAAGSVSFNTGWDQDLVLDGRRAECFEKIKAVRITGVPPAEDARTDRTPGAGEKIFVDVERRYGRDSAHAAIQETRTLCFMTPKSEEEARRDVENPHRRAIREPSYEPTHTLTLTPTPALLFRFSALTFNAHAIHLDRQHCREVEGYRDLLVHGPLLLTLMFSALRGALESRGKSVKSLDYRNLAPVYVNEEMKVCVREGKENKWDVWIASPEGGGLCVKGTAVVE